MGYNPNNHQKASQAKMPSITLHPHASSPPVLLHNPLPHILQTPSGLAILELQGTINLPSLDDQGAVPHRTDAEDRDPTITAFETPIGKLMFPDYSPQTTSPDDTKWMKRVYLYVGRYQRMTGEVKKLAQPLALVQKRKKHSHSDGNGERIAESEGEELEIVEIIKYKLLFKNRPEPVNDS
jgi:chromosome transmission fidelity protein 8